MARFLLALPAPAGDHPDHPVLRLVTTLLAGGRTSRLHEALVDLGQLCAWVAADLSENLDGSQLSIAGEVVPGIEPARVEAELLRLLDEMVRRPPAAAEVERARQIATADWVFGHERVHQQAISLGLSVTLFDLGYIDRHLRELLAATPERVAEVASLHLRPERGAVLGWSLPRAEP